MEAENQTEAESLATWLEHISGGISAQKAASELRRLSARVQELEAMLESVGAGGVSAQRVTQQAHSTEREAFEKWATSDFSGINVARDGDDYSFVPAKEWWLAWQARAALDADHITQPRKMAAAQEPFGYFKAEPFGWTDCAETDEGAIALYEAPQPLADALDAELLDWLESEVCDSHTGVTINRIDHREDGMVIERGFRLRRFHKDYKVKPTLRAAIAAAKEI